MKLGFFCYPSGCATFADGVRETQKFGLKYIEPSTGNRDLSPFLDESELIENAKKARALIDETGLIPSAYSYGCDLIGPKRNETMANLKKAAKVCQIMGVPYLHHTVYVSEPNNKVPVFKDALPEIIETVREIYDFAEQLGVKCVYEDQGFVLNGCERFERFLEEIDRDVKVVADVGNIYDFEETPEMFIGRFYPYIVHVHLKDYLWKPSTSSHPGKYWYKTIAGNYLRDTVIGHGCIDFESIFKLLHDNGYDGTFSLECGGLEWQNYNNTSLCVDNALRLWENAKAKSL